MRRPVGATVVAKSDATFWTWSLQAKMLSSGSSSKLMSMAGLLSGALVVMLGEVGVVMFVFVD